MDLKHQLLIAMPAMADPNFSGSVVYICDHSDKGALGLVINRPTELILSTLFERIDLKLEIAPWKDAPVFFGGPVQTERGFVLHEKVPGDGGSYSSSIEIAGGGLEMTTSKDVLEALSQGLGPKKVLITLGYSGWSAGQLEDELGRNGWLTVDAAPEVIFDTPVEQRYERALALLGIDPRMLSGEAGHA
jgi:putative transcriptional regulator